MRAGSNNPALAAMWLLLPAAALPAAAQTSVADSLPGAPESSLRVEHFQEIRVKNQGLPEYPEELRRESQEAWVIVNFMVSTEGKPFEAYVAQSIGDKAFQREALRAIKYWSFDPALVDGKPVESAASVKLKFALIGGTEAASEEFGDSYRALAKAIEKDNRSDADAIKAKLHIKNLYEDAFFGLIEYRYALKWGNDAQQMAALRRAIAGESLAHYLPRATFAAALDALLPLEINSHDFSSALQTWASLQKSGVDPRELARFKPTIDTIEALRNDGRAFEVSGQITDSGWSLKLFKRHFQLTPTDGHISELKLHCKTAFVSFPFDPTLEYKVSEKYGDCWLAVNGDPGTDFKLTER